jgi:hypothetical protein
MASSSQKKEATWCSCTITGIAPQAKAKRLKTGGRVSYELTQEKMAGLWGRNVGATD